MAEPAGSVVLDRVTKRFGGVTAVEQVTLEVEPGEFFSLLGPSGCGKTTSLRMIAGFERPDDGRVRVGGTDVTDVPPHRRPVNTVFQSYALFPHLNVEDNVAFGLRFKRVTKQERRRAVGEALALVRLEGYERRKPGQLSGGQQQRVGVARGLAADPNILLMDEPFGAVDPIVRDELQRELLRLQRDLDKTIVFVTHDIDEAFLLGDQVVILKQGGVVAQVGSPAEILANPADDFVRSFVGLDKGGRTLHVEERDGASIVVDSTGKATGILAS
jgi:osmoprotectant transport system ATP-binding protein